MTFTHHQAVATLDADQQRELLTEVAVERLTVTETRARKKRMVRQEVSEGTARLRGRFRVLWCDPDYDNMTIDELAALPVAAHMLENAVAFLVCDERHRFEVKTVLDAWQFEHRSAFVWDRVLHQGQPGAYLDVRHEHVLIAVRGKCAPDNLTPMFDSVVTLRRGPEHGEPPEEWRKKIERLYDHGPYLELLAKRKMTREGWTFYGRQMGAKVA